MIERPINYNNWFEYENNIFKINEYPNVNFTPTTFQDALIRQAKTIYNDLKPAVFISGGIDSQAMALGFILAELDVEYIYVRPSYYGHYSKLEYFFVEQFCKRHNIDLTIIDLEFDKYSLFDFLFEHDFFDTPAWAGTIFVSEGIRRYEGNGIPTVGIGMFVFDNTDNNQQYRHPKCRGTMPPGGVGGTSLNRDQYYQKHRMKDQILFNFYYNYIFQYYEHMHRTTPELQYLSKMDAKNLIYTQLGFPFRPKMSGWEFLDDAGDYPSLSVINWSGDHGKYARLTRGIDVIVEKLGMSENYIKDKLNIQRNICREWITLYEFEGEVIL